MTLLCSGFGLCKHACGYGPSAVARMADMPRPHVLAVSRLVPSRSRALPCEVLLN